ncbi:GNAT family N-acetyltransferase [Acidisphaera sp. L21]|uniref:GNAT family N-acetyltransferase n=1 Tax=Acidisphaera sp. L21 TaxID=1641851 RepID=UPI00131B1A07|nr:GNAT family N-acetyltransferase [Acidisphaera sp. L21]
MIRIGPETPDQNAVRVLLDEAERRTASLYPAESQHGLTIDKLIAHSVRFFVARLDGDAIGCGGYIVAAKDTAEVKRMFVAERARGKGVGRLLLQTVEDFARAEGIEFLQLETGVKSAEALGLYRRFGYQDRGPFGSYQPDPLSVFMEKILPQVPVQGLTPSDT